MANAKLTRGKSFHKQNEGPYLTVLPDCQAGTIGETLSTNRGFPESCNFEYTLAKVFSKELRPKGTLRRYAKFTLAPKLSVFNPLLILCKINFVHNHTKWFRMNSNQFLNY